MKIDAQHVNDAYIALIGQRNSELLAMSSHVVIERMEQQVSDAVFTQPHLVFVCDKHLDFACKEALSKSAIALGYNPEFVAFMQLLEEASAASLRLCIELVDPEAIVAVDERGSTLLEEALQSDEGDQGTQRLTAGLFRYAQGRRLLHIPSFATTFTDTQAKQSLWDALRRMSFRKTVY